MLRVIFNIIQRGIEKEGEGEIEREIDKPDEIGS